ncbi:IclR family transcriptional regulator [Halostagnicola kamekurae]|uniref:DNA-binding transcriptional regulator, IclR family n=1 Tax=Halostagnicola kamekurae TaxID=619731 RepID=A0A1I6TP92_9EURY|nr:IclR family transcriptional regulator [Halostagnicola kamekurae]SFS90974.1 DNA-binding transcriptional regulator, IclR family [Halostagnicola kamekurae]
MTKPNNGGIQAIERTFTIVEALNELDGAGVSELARHVDLPKSTVHNHLNTLEAAEYIVRRGDEYRTGLKFLQTGEIARNQHKLYQVARSEVDKLAEKTGDISGLMTEEHGRGVFIYRGRGSEAARIDTHIGDRIPLHCTALGKVIMAFLPDERVEEIIDRHGLAAITHNTITDRDRLLEELEVARERKIAFDDEERLNGLRSVAAPILDGSNTVIGAISVAGPTHRMQGERFREELPDQALGVANIIELNIQHS